MSPQEPRLDQLPTEVQIEAGSSAVDLMLKEFTGVPSDEEWNRYVEKSRASYEERARISNQKLYHEEFDSQNLDQYTVEDVETQTPAGFFFARVREQKRGRETLTTDDMFDVMILAVLGGTDRDLLLEEKKKTRLNLAEQRYIFQRVNQEARNSSPWGRFGMLSRIIDYVFANETDGVESISTQFGQSILKKEERFKKLNAQDYQKAVLMAVVTYLAVWRLAEHQSFLVLKMGNVDSLVNPFVCSLPNYRNNNYDDPYRFARRKAGYLAMSSSNH